MPAIEVSPQTSRRKLFTLLGAAIAAGAIGYGIYWYTVASRYVSTDNAYTSTEVAQVTPEVGGTVSRYNPAVPTLTGLASNCSAVWLWQNPARFPGMKSPWHKMPMPQHKPI
jgi:hypothetical protein